MSTWRMQKQQHSLAFLRVGTSRCQSRGRNRNVEADFHEKPSVGLRQPPRQTLQRGAMDLTVPTPGLYPFRDICSPPTRLFVSHPLAQEAERPRWSAGTGRSTA